MKKNSFKTILKICAFLLFTTVVSAHSISNLNSEIKPEDITIYPNPNHGSFSIISNKLKAKGLIAEIYDASGRLIFKKAYSTYDNFNETINLKDVNSGLYILVLNDGVKKTSKRIIVE